MELLVDPLFRIPFVTGLCLSLLLPLLGAYLRLRDEWLAALGFVHLGGAGGVIGSVVPWPPLATALGAAALGVGLRSTRRRAGNDGYAVMILAGWAVMILGASLDHTARVMGQALIDGQLYFTGNAHVAAVATFALCLGALLPALSRRLLRARLMPGFDAVNGSSGRLDTLLFTALTAFGVTLAAMSVGVMAAFALTFIPPWVAFRVAISWRGALALATLAGAVAFTASFVVALLVDLPFGPTLVAVLVLLAALRAVRRPPG